VIIIFSVSNDYTTFEVMKWLNYMGQKNVLRINSDEKDNIIFKLNNDKCELSINGQEVDLDDVSAVWYRKGGNWFGQQFEDISINNSPELSRYMNYVSDNENKVLNNYIHYLIKRKVRVLGSAFKSNLNKLMTLDQAKSVGLSIPDFHVSNELQEMKNLTNSHEDYITKSMSDGVYYFDSEHSETAYFTYTENLTNEGLQGLPEKIAPSFAQCKIEKKHEVRTFFLDGEFYSWAILSQNDDKTKTDYRKYNNTKPNRNLSMNIPEHVQSKLRKLFALIGLNTGSIDLMVDHNEQYYFLEINPVGQFGLLSSLSNCQIEKHVATWLIQNEK